MNPTQVFFDTIRKMFELIRSVDQQAVILPAWTPAEDAKLISQPITNPHQLWMYQILVRDYVLVTNPRSLHQAYTDREGNTRTQAPTKATFRILTKISFDHITQSLDASFSGLNLRLSKKVLATLNTIPIAYLLGTSNNWNLPALNQMLTEEISRLVDKGHSEGV